MCIGGLCGALSELVWRPANGCCGHKRHHFNPRASKIVGAKCHPDQTMGSAECSPHRWRKVPPDTPHTILSRARIVTGFSFSNNDFGRRRDRENNFSSVTSERPAKKQVF